MIRRHRIAPDLTTMDDSTWVQGTIVAGVAAWPTAEVLRIPPLARNCAPGPISDIMSLRMRAAGVRDETVLCLQAMLDLRFQR